MHTTQPNKPIALLVAEVKLHALKATPNEQSAALAVVDGLVAGLKKGTLNRAQ